METKALKKQLGAAIAMVLVAAIALGAATFAWFVNNNAVTAKGVDVTTSSAVPNLYITDAGKTTDAMTANDAKNPDALLPVSTSDGIHFYDTKHWTSASKEETKHAFADQYKEASRADGKNSYAEYTFTLGVSNGSMNIYFDFSTSATTLKANGKMGTAGRFAIRFGDGDWRLFKVTPSGATDNKSYYTDKSAENADSGDFAVKAGTNQALNAEKITYSNFNTYAGSIDSVTGQASAGATALAQVSSDSPVTVTVRVWYEGCDPQCVSENAGSTGIANAVTGNLGFVGVQPTTTAGGGA